MNNKIAFIIPYFGRWPEWMPLYLYSCSRQKGIDFLFFTDCERPGRTYPNTRFFPISFADYCQKVSSALAIGFRPSSPYKLCDLKPFYGLIHREELSGYDWWGFGDMDVVYGSICTSSFSNKQDTGLSAPPTGAKATITSRPTTTSLKVAS